LGKQSESANYWLTRTWT